MTQESTPINTLLAFLDNNPEFKAKVERYTLASLKQAIQLASISAIMDNQLGQLERLHQEIEQLKTERDTLADQVKSLRLTQAILDKERCNLERARAEREQLDAMLLDLGLGSHSTPEQKRLAVINLIFREEGADNVCSLPSIQ